MGKEIEQCEECGSTDIEQHESGYNIVNRSCICWESYKCLDCGHITSDEPDCDFLPGGKDYD